LRSPSAPTDNPNIASDANDDLWRSSRFARVVGLRDPRRRCRFGDDGYGLEFLWQSCCDFDDDR
jgi:hypothetical protein